MVRSFVTRRNFLAGTALLAGSGLWSGSNLTQAAEPFKRNGQPHLKLSLAAYSFRDFLGGKTPSMTMHDFIDLCAANNLDGCELTSYWFPENITTEYLLSLCVPLLC